MFLIFAVVDFVLRGVPLKLATSVYTVKLALAKMISMSAAFSRCMGDGMVLYINVFMMNRTLFRAKVTGGVKNLIAEFTEAREALVVTVVMVMNIVSKFLSGANATTILVPMIYKVTSRSNCSEDHLLVPLMFTTTLNKGLSVVNTPKGLVNMGTLRRVKLSADFFVCTPIKIPVLLMKVVCFIFVKCEFLPSKGKTMKTAIRGRGSFDSMPG